MNVIRQFPRPTINQEFLLMSCVVSLITSNYQQRLCLDIYGNGLWKKQTGHAHVHSCWMILAYGHNSWFPAGLVVWSRPKSIINFNQHGWYMLDTTSKSFMIAEQYRNESWIMFACHQPLLLINSPKSQAGCYVFSSILYHQSLVIVKQVSPVWCSLSYISLAIIQSYSIHLPVEKNCSMRCCCEPAFIELLVLRISYHGGVHTRQRHEQSWKTL